MKRDFPTMDEYAADRKKSPPKPKKKKVETSRPSTGRNQMSAAMKLDAQDQERKFKELREKNEKTKQKIRDHDKKMIEDHERRLE